MHEHWLVRPWSHQNVGRQLIGQAMITLKCHLSALEISYPFEECKTSKLCWFHINLILNCIDLTFKLIIKYTSCKPVNSEEGISKQGNTALTQNWTFNNIRLLNIHNIVLIVLSTFISYFMVIGFMTYPLQIINIQFSVCVNINKKRDKNHKL